MSLKADSLCAAINLRGPGKQHMNIPAMNFCLSPAQAEPRLGVGNTGMAVPTADQGHSTHLQSPTLRDVRHSPWICLVPTSALLDDLGETRGCSHQAQRRGHTVWETS